MTEIQTPVRYDGNCGLIVDADGDEIYFEQIVIAINDHSRLLAELAEYEGIEGRCPKGHNKKFTYELEGQTGCVVCENDSLTAENERLKFLLEMAAQTIRLLAEQQAMSDQWYIGRLAEIEAALAEVTNEK